MIFLPVFVVFSCVGFSLQISLDLTEPCFEVDEDFLSVTIDASNVCNNFENFISFRSNKLVSLASELKPVTVRVGGTSQDYLIFEDISRKRKRDAGNVPKDTEYYMTSSQFDLLNQFVNQSGWNLIFGLNQLLRFPNGKWDFSDAELLIDYCMKKGYNVGWELGNEPDLYLKHHITNITGAQGVENIQCLRKILTHKNYPVTWLAGPDVAILDYADYFAQYLSVVQDTINATTWHHYYCNSATAKLFNFFSVSMLDSLMDKIDEMLQIIDKAAFNRDLWIGETSSTYGGGTPLYSSSYVAGFMWLDKLGLAAYNHTKIFRQDLIGKHYSLLDSTGYPLPDYWLTLLHKKLVGTKVLNVEGVKNRGRSVRVYAHCAKLPYAKGSVVLLILNLFNESVAVELENIELRESSRDVYWLTPYPLTNITSQIVALNGAPLFLNDDNSFPPLTAEERDPKNYLSLQALSFGFVVFKNSKIKACLY